MQWAKRTVSLAVGNGAQDATEHFGIWALVQAENF
jgi:hypothetical protein